jgi:phosphoglycerate dehydrogenase-like enzyme
MMIGPRELGLMKPDAILVNTARGQVIDEDAMIKALQNGKPAAAGLDVFQNEPLPADSLLRKLGHKVLLSPHMGTSNLNSGLKPGIEWATRSVFAALRGEVPDNVYNKEVIPKWLERFGGRTVL